jgi:hypothetical protein
MPSSAQPPHAAMNPRRWLRVSPVVDAVAAATALVDDTLTSPAEVDITSTPG